MRVFDIFKFNKSLRWGALCSLLFCISTLLNATEFTFAPNQAANFCNTTPASDLQALARHTSNWTSCVTSAEGELTSDNTFTGHYQFVIRANPFPTNRRVTQLSFNNASGATRTVTVTGTDASNAPLPVTETFDVPTGVHTIDLAESFTGFRQLTIQFSDVNLTTFYLRGFTAPTLVNGSCGSANGIPRMDEPSSNLCSAGIPSSVVSDVAAYTWSCAGTGGGSSDNCLAPRLYSITFATAGGSAVPQMNLEVNSVIVEPAAPVREGFSFLEWSPALPAIMPAENVVVTAQWAINQYSISFNSAGGSVVAGASYDFGAPVTSPEAPTRAGFTFAGWNPGLPMTMPASNVSVTAQWAVNQYSISFDSAGGSAVPVITADFGAAITAPAEPTRAGFTFIGWTPALPATMPATSQTHTAQWAQASFTVTASLIGEGSITPASQQVNAGQSASFVLSVSDDSFVQIQSDCAASRSGNTIVTAAIKGACTITLTVHPAVQSEVEDSSPASSLEARRFRLSEGAGEQVLTALQQTRSGTAEWLDITEADTLLTLQDDGSYLFSAERTGRYTFEFTDSVSGEQVSVSFDVLPYIAFTASSQPVQQDVAARARVWLSDEPIDYPVRVAIKGEQVLLDSSHLELMAADKRRRAFMVTATASSDGELTLLSDGLEQALLGTPHRQRLAVQPDQPPLVLQASVTQDTAEGFVIQQSGGLVELVATELNGVTAEYSWQAAEFELSANGATASFDPAGLALGRYYVQLTAAAGQQQGELELALNVVADCPVADCSNSGVSGIPASQNPQAGVPHRLPLCPQGSGSSRVAQCIGQPGLFVEVPNQYQLTLGLFSEQQSWQSGQFGVALNEASLFDTGYQQLGFLVNMDVIGLDSPGESVPVAIPMPAGQSIPAGAVWRKLVSFVWQDFVEDDNNQIDSAPRNALGNCPGVSSDAWRSGLNEGDACVRLTIEDGGPNDDDGRANGVIRDPGVLALQQTATISFDSAGGSAVASITGLVGSALTPPAAPSREGYTFTGWQPAFPETMPEDDVQLTAQWQPSSVTVTSKGGSLGVLSALVLAMLVVIRRLRSNKARRNVQLRMLCVSALFLPMLVWADGWYLGVQGGVANSHSSGNLAGAVQRKLNDAGISGTVTQQSNSDTAYRLFAGYQFNDWLSAELGWLDLGEAKLHYDGLPVNQPQATLKAQPQRGRGAELSLVGQLVLDAHWQPYVRLALFDNRSRYLFSGTAAQGPERKSGIRLGAELGIGYQLNSQLQLRAAAAHYDTENFSTRLFSLGLRYSF